jgi:hypothetical protein
MHLEHMHIVDSRKNSFANINFANIPLEIKYMITAPAIDLYSAACQWKYWVFCEPIIYPIDEAVEQNIIKKMSEEQDTKFIKIFEMMVKHGGVTPAMHNAIYFASKNKNKPLTHWLYENVNKVCCHENCTLTYSALLGAVTSGDIKWIKWVFTKYNNEGCKQLINDNFVFNWSIIDLLDVVPFNWIADNFQGQNYLGNCMHMYAVEHNNLPLLQFIHKFRIGDVTSRIDTMIRYHHIEMIKWVCETVPITLSQRQLKNILYRNESDMVELVEWFYKRGLIENSEENSGIWLFHLACETQRIPLLNWIVSRDFDTTNYDPQQLLIKGMENSHDLILWLMENSLLDIRDWELFKEQNQITLCVEQINLIKPGVLENLLEYGEFDTAKSLKFKYPYKLLHKPCILETLKYINASNEVREWVFKFVL